MSGEGQGHKGLNWLAKARKGGKSIRNALKTTPGAPPGKEVKQGPAIDIEATDQMTKANEKVMMLLKTRRITPRNCPPFLPDTLDSLLKKVLAIRKETPELSAEANEYMRHFVMVFLEKTKAIARILKTENSKALREERSAVWRSITRMTLTLHHNLRDIEAIFPNNKYITEFRLAKNKADDFWKDHFDKQASVPWEIFSEAFTKVHPVSSKEELGALWVMMDITESGCISWFEFDVFTRLFQPWTNIIDNWKVLTVAHPAYKSYITYTEMNAILEGLKQSPGSYIYRVSASTPGHWVVGYVSRRGLIVQTQPVNKAMFQTLIDFAEDRTCIYPGGQRENPDIRRKVNVDPTEYVKVTDEEEEMYMAMGTTFGMCKICANNQKNLRINPCGHMMCNECLNDWTKTGGKVCPFCRDDIIDIDEIIVESKAEPESTSSSTPAQEAVEPNEMEDTRTMAGAVSAIFHYTDDPDNADSSESDEEPATSPPPGAASPGNERRPPPVPSRQLSSGPPLPERGRR